MQSVTSAGHSVSILLYTVQTSQAFTSWLRRGLASSAILFLCSSFTGIRGLKNFGGWGENALKGLTVKAWGFSDVQPGEDKRHRFTGTEHFNQPTGSEAGMEPEGISGRTKELMCECSWPWTSRVWTAWVHSHMDFFSLNVQSALNSLRVLPPRITEDWLWDLYAGAPGTSGPQIPSDGYIWSSIKTGRQEWRCIYKVKKNRHRPGQQQKNQKPNFLPSCQDPAWASLHRPISTHADFLFLWILRARIICKCILALSDLLAYFLHISFSQLDFKILASFGFCPCIRQGEAQS